MIKLVVLDEIVILAIGGAHRDHKATAEAVKEAIARHLSELNRLSPKELVEDRYNKFRAMSKFLE